MLRDPRKHCPNRMNHTECPEGYMQWYSWAAKKSRTHKQVLCSGCGRFSIWVEKKNKLSVVR